MIIMIVMMVTVMLMRGDEVVVLHVMLVMR